MLQAFKLKGAKCRVTDPIRGTSVLGRMRLDLEICIAPIAIGGQTNNIVGIFNKDSAVLRPLGLILKG